METDLVASHLRALVPMAGRHASFVAEQQAAVKGSHGAGATSRIVVGTPLYDTSLELCPGHGRKRRRVHRRTLWRASARIFRTGLLGLTVTFPALGTSLRFARAKLRNSARIGAEQAREKQIALECRPECFGRRRHWTRRSYRRPNSRTSGCGASRRASGSRPV